MSDGAGSRGNARGMVGQGSRGFTLIELLVTVVVLAVVLAIAAPSFRGVINGNRITAATNEYVGLFQAAKMEAIRRNASVTACPSNAAGTACDGTNWRRALIVASDGSVLRLLESDATLVVRASPAITGATPANRVVFRPDGVARIGGAGGAILTGKIEVCMVTTQPQQNARWVSVSGARVSVDPARTAANCTSAIQNS